MSSWDRFVQRPHTFDAGVRVAHILARSALLPARCVRVPHAAGVGRFSVQDR